jgi:hypothetical protein
MYFKLGDKVVLKYTGDAGEVTSMPEMGIVQVKISHDLVIPVNIEDLVEFRNDVIIPQTKKVEIINESVDGNISYPESKLRNTGFFTGFLPQTNKYGEILLYHIYLINDTNQNFIFEYTLDSKELKINKNGVLNGCSVFLVGKIEKEAIENQATFQIQRAELYTSGAENHVTQTVKIKAKTFFSKEEILPFLDKLGYLFEFKVDPIKTETGESLKDFTNAVLLNKPKAQPKPHYVKHIDPIKKAVFTNELDLHIESLIDPATKLDPPHILQLQMAHFDQYMAEAVRLGIEKVYIVHGLGTGRLKNEIAKRLNINPYVLEYKNEYLPSYGFGATEVRLR